MIDHGDRTMSNTYFGKLVHIRSSVLAVLQVVADYSLVVESKTHHESVCVEGCV